MKRLKIIQIFLAIIFVFSFGSCGKKASNFTEEEHMARIAKRVEARYFSEGSGYNFTDYEVHPVYDENDELKYAVVDFAPSGFIVVIIRENDLGWLGGASMYTLSAQNSVLELWRPYIITPGQDSQTVISKYGMHCCYSDRQFLVDDNGEFITYYNSFYKIAGVEKERYYLLSIEQNGRDGLIPAVKRGDKYLNLISMQEMEYVSKTEEFIYHIADFAFIVKPQYNL